jgi:autotransporter translocation and assembly factor TamB
VGKNVTDRLYVAVEQTLGTDGDRRLRSEYVLTDWLNLEGSSTSLGAYVVDLLFKFGFR